MFLFLFSLCVASIYRLRFTTWNEDYLGVNQTTAIKGFFIGLVFLSHLKTYLDLSLCSFLDSYAVLAIKKIGQLMVAFFFFCSGYGVLISYRKKKNYEKGFLKKRVLKTLVHFDMALILYLVLSWFTGKRYGVLQILLSLVGWESVGNSNWFIFVTLSLYLITWFAFVFKNKTDGREWSIIVFTFGLCAGLWIFLRILKASYWYNTLFCYPLGILFAFHKDAIDRLLKKQIPFLLFVLLSIILFFLLYNSPGQIAYSACSMVFCVLVLLVSAKVYVYSPILSWMGKYLFELYILQRVPMIILHYYGMKNHLFFGLISIGVTVLLSMVFRAIEQRTDESLKLN